MGIRLSVVGHLFCSIPFEDISDDLKNSPSFLGIWIESGGVWHALLTVGEERCGCSARTASVVIKVTWRF